MSNMKNGFSTLNRWLGKKSKTDKGTPNGKLSKSSTNLSSLSVSSTNINQTSQLEYNRITPLPVVTSNAPFEQTFRITVLLPKDQLYVARLGARVPLSKLLELVCENKLLDASKYEFRNPVDASQVYSCDLTIGAVGLSEVRLCHKSESYDNFNAEEIIKLHRTTIIRDSLSSSEFSSRYSKHTTKTTSPYSSSNSLNSMDSTGMNCVRTPVSPPATLPTSTNPIKIAAPPRKKRAAPRPPSQIAIPEKTALDTNGEATIKAAQTNGADMLERADDAVALKTRYVSTPNLSVTLHTNGDINSPTVEKAVESNLNSYAYSDVEQEQLQIEQKNARNLRGGSVQNLASPRILQQSIEFPEPSPRKRMMQMKKKTAAPAPPQRESMYADPDTASIQSMTPPTPETPLTPLTPHSPSLSTMLESQLTLNASSDNSNKPQSPTPPARETEQIATPLQSSTPVIGSDPSETGQVPLESPPSVPKPQPRVTTNTLLNASTTSIEDSPTNVSKIMLNRTPTPEPRSVTTEHSDSDSYLSAHIASLKDMPVVEHDDDVSSNQMDSVSYLSAHIAALKGASTSEHDDDALSKQADSGIGEPVPSPIPDSLPSESSAHEGKSAFESSSDDDDIVKVYNFKLGKTVVKTPPEPHTLQDFVALTAEVESDSGDNTPAPTPATEEATPNFSDTASWNFTIPISPPPNFADGRFSSGFESEKTPDTPITPKIKERPVLNFDSISQTEKCDSVAVGNTNPNVADSHGKQNKIDKTESLPSPTTPLNEIVDELSAIINEKLLDTLIKKAEDQPNIEAAKPNTLANFSITTITQQVQDKQPEITKSIETKTPVAAEVESFEADAARSSNTVESEVMENYLPKEKVTELENLINAESTLAQFVDLKVEQNGFSSSRRRSSGELSIGESPSLQSPDVIKTILNSRKNSVASSSEGESKAVVDTTKLFERKATETPKKSYIAEQAEKVSILSPEPISKTTKPKELPKVYRYSGPPSINFSTWSERPKVQVSIKNEGDYIFGGKNADSQSAAVTTAAIEISTNSQARNGRISMPASAFWAERENAPPPVAPKPATFASPTERMGIPEKECRVPLTVKPLRDVTAENVELRIPTTSCTTQQAPTKIATRKSTTTTTVLLNGDYEAENNRSEPIIKRSFATTLHTSTLPRNNTNRFSTPAIHTVGPALLRSTSVTQLEANKSKPTHREVSAAPFGQNTLRKTGLKEKILAREAEAQQKEKGDSNTNTHSSKPKPTNTKYATTISNGFVNITKPATVQSTKLELKLQNSSSVYLNQTSTKSTTNTTATSKHQSTVKSAINTPPPPPPVPPKGTHDISTTAKHNIPDTRDQLLVAIRNFKREGLNRV